MHRPRGSGADIKWVILLFVSLGVGMALLVTALTADPQHQPSSVTPDTVKAPAQFYRVTAD